MKKVLSALLLSMLVLPIKSQVVKLKDITELKHSKIIVALSGDDDLNIILRETIDKHWSFCEVVDFVDSKSAYNRAKAEDGLFVLELTTKLSQSLTHYGKAKPYVKKQVLYDYCVISSGTQISISKKSTINPPIYQLIPTYSNNVTEESLVFGLTALQYMFKTLEENKMSSDMSLVSAYKKNSHQLNKKTLCVPETWIDDKLDISTIPTLYKGKIKVVSFQDWQNTILSGEDDVAYCMIVAKPVAGSYAFFHYLVDSKTGVVYAIVFPRFTVSMEIPREINEIDVIFNNLTPPKQIEFNRANTGYINSKIISMYNEALEEK